MVWLILIVRLSRTAPRQRRGVSRELAAAGAVSISDGVWAIPDTSFHRSVMKACSRRAVKAGGDLVMMSTSPESAPTHDFLEAALAEHLTSESAALARRHAAYLAGNRTETPENFDVEVQNKTLEGLRLEADRLSRKNVLELEAVNTVVASLRETAALPA